MKRNSAIIFAILFAAAFFIQTVSARLAIKNPKPGFAVGALGSFVAPAHTNQIFLPYYRSVLPVKITGTSEKWDAAVFQAAAFYGNSLNVFPIQ